MKAPLRLFFLAAFSCAVFFAEAQQTNPSADAILKEATALAAKEKKKVFVMFHASWCGWCHKMDTIMSSPACKALFDKSYVIRHITVLENDSKKHLETPGGQELRVKYEGDKLGIPYWLIFDAKGTFITDARIRKAGSAEKGANTGCPATPEEIEYFIRTLRETSSLTNDELKIIETEFGKIRG